MAIFFTAWFFFLITGGRSFFDGLADTDGYDDRDLRVLSAIAAGLMFNIANVLLVIGIQVAGLAVAFPIGIGTALVLGTCLTKIIDPTGDNAFLFSGVGLAFLAVCANALAAKAMEEVKVEGDALTSSLNSDDALEKQGLISNDGEENALSENMSSSRKIALCVVAGLLMSLWSPLNAYAIGGDDDDGMTPYGAFALFSSAVALSSIPILLVLGYFGLVESVSWKLYLCPFFGDSDAFGGDRRSGLPGGFVWSIGFLANSLAGNALGFALSYSIGQSAPMVATLWGLLYYKEFEKAPAKSLHYVALMFLLYIGAIVLIALS